MKTITLLEPIVNINPANTLVFEVNYMHGDADVYNTIEHVFSLDTLKSDQELNDVVHRFKDYLLKYVGKRPPSGVSQGDDTLACWDLEVVDASVIDYFDIDRLAKIEWVRIYAYDEDGVMRHVKFS